MLQEKIDSFFLCLFISFFVYLFILFLLLLKGTYGKWNVELLEIGYIIFLMLCSKVQHMLLSPFPTCTERIFTSIFLFSNKQIQCYIGTQQSFVKSYKRILLKNVRANKKGENLRFYQITKLKTEI